MNSPLQNRAERYAWVVVSLSLAAFTLLVTLLTAGGLWYRSQAVREQDAHLIVVGGTVLARAKGEVGWTSTPAEAVLESGGAVRTDENSRAFLTLFDGTTVLLYPRSELELTTLATSRFGTRPDQITMVVRQGTARISLGPPVSEERTVQVRAGEAAMTLAEGSFSVFVNGGHARLRVYEIGSARIEAGGQSAVVAAGEKVDVLADPPTLLLQPAKEELVANGDFSQGLTGWQVVSVRCPDGRPGRGVVTGEGYGARLRLSRSESQSAYCATEAVQELGRDVSSFGSLRLSASLRLLSQSLPGGGPLGTVYPLSLRVDYRTTQGEGTYLVGFYYWNDAANRTDGAVMAPQGQDFEFTAPVDLMSLVPQPMEVTSVTVSAAGWDYDGLVNRVSLVAE